MEENTFIDGNCVHAKCTSCQNVGYLCSVHPTNEDCPFIKNGSVPCTYACHGLCKLSKKACDFALFVQNGCNPDSNSRKADSEIVAEKISEFQATWEHYNASYFWKPEKIATYRRNWEERNSFSLKVSFVLVEALKTKAKVQRVTLEYTQKAEQSCSNVYIYRKLFENGVQVTAARFNTLLKKLGKSNVCAFLVQPEN